ncbi:DNA-binding protein, partial [Halomonas sp. AOP4-A1-5]
MWVSHPATTDRIPPEKPAQARVFLCLLSYKHHIMYCILYHIKYNMKYKIRYNWRKYDMARPGISFEHVAHAADTLVGRGERPTIAAVRDEIGTGSPNTIHRHLQQWR